MTQNPTYKRLRRSRTDRMLAGVYGGLASYLGVDPVAVRLGYALITFVTGGLALLAYPVMWIMMPEESTVTPAGQPPAGPQPFSGQPFSGQPFAGQPPTA
jgi:phage shock protein C